MYVFWLMLFLFYFKENKTFLINLTKMYIYIYMHIFLLFENV